MIGEAGASISFCITFRRMMNDEMKMMVELRSVAIIIERVHVSVATRNNCVGGC